MKITFYSNFLTHHQLPFCLKMQEKFGKNFKFVSTIKITEERLNLGYKNIDNDFDFVVRAYENEETYNKALKLALDSDIVIMGSTSDVYIQERLKMDKLTFRYRERIFQTGFINTFLNREKRKTIYNRHIKYKNNKNLYMLCANGYGANDFYRIGKYKDKIYKWGYFPKTEKYDIEKLIKEKGQNIKFSILWTGRFKAWKHPEYMIKLAKKLKSEKYNFTIIMLGNGEQYVKIQNQIEKNKLNDCIQLLGSVDSDKVRGYMEKANVYCFTSDKQEGWGAVLNEAMNSGCAVVANKNIGAVPFLIEEGKNGITYNNFKGFYSGVKKLLNQKELRDEISKNAYLTITNIWNSENATEKLIQLFNNILENKTCNIEDGPGSKALPI